jgi:fatty-acyl-CoA synthase
VRSDGSIHLLGRGSVCINSGGEKIFPEEVEESLKTHQAVRDAVVVGIPHPTFGEQIVAVVELDGEGDGDGDGAPSEVELIEHVKGRLAPYKAPRRVRVVDTIGRAPNGKVDYKRHRAESIDELGALT